jgi:phosphomethylpyrimidine synthase
VRISKEINQFMSGKDDAAQPLKRATASPGVTDAGSDVLKQRGNLTPEEIHKLAHKGRSGKAQCHSDNVAEPEKAQLVQLNTLKAHGMVVNETGI